ncbi:translation initiation factor IF-2, mitochondrial isoform X2 [Macrobrachium rosenbergii]|uniref:translation initiation factor IF-2, mitochondrial isoform X2 n=1 Tax=Macrobrachium rosenbergii TaxID=79674 RepID=UPI0034D5BF93
MPARILMKRGCQLSTSVRPLPLLFQGVPDVPSQGSSAFFHGACMCSLCGHCHRALLHSSSSHYRKKIDKKPVSVNPKGIKRERAPTVSVWKNMTVQELADAVGRDLDTLFEIFLYVEDSEIYDSPRTPIDNVKVIQEAVKRAGFRCDFSSNPLRVEKKKENKDAVKRPPPLESELVSRPPVVTIMGHVDHGKTTLLDALRHTSVVDTEFGGITQHIGAFAVKLDTGEQVTFLDTPGHAAFKAMRARGANVTDMVVLVVAADDGVMLQTKESIEHAQEARVPIIIAINKIDKPEADIERCRQMLLDCGLQLEEQGGEVQAVPVSALKGQNLDLLIEAIATEAELLNLRADSKGLVEASVVEARTDPGRGKVVTCIIQRGTLRKGAVLVAGTAWGKVRNMFSDSGKPLKDAPPATPVQIIGWRDLPAAGDLIIEVESERRANEVIDWRKQQLSLQKQKEAEIIIQERLNEHLKVYRKQLEERRMQGRRYGKRREPRQKESREEDTGPRVSVVLKGDVDGSVEAILDVIDTYHSTDCQLYVLSYGVGMVTPSDVTMAATFKGTIYAFNVDVPKEIRKLAATEGVTIKSSNIIYRLIEDLQEEISNNLPLKDVEEILGEANVLAEFIVTEGKKKIPVAGCRCIKGTLKRDASYRVMRREEVIHEGELQSMRHLKSEVKSIPKEKECGLMFQDEEVRFELGDTILCYTVNKVKQVTDWDPGF